MKQEYQELRLAAALSHAKEPAMGKVSAAVSTPWSRPRPIAYSQHEGEEWQRWVPIEERIAAWHEINPDDMTDEEVKVALAKVPRNPPEIFHAVMFDDGSIFDTVNGWRGEPDLACLERVKAWIAMTEEEKQAERNRFYNR